MHKHPWHLTLSCDRAIDHRREGSDSRALLDQNVQSSDPSLEILGEFADRSGQTVLQIKVVFVGYEALCVLRAGPADPFAVSGDPYALTGGQTGAQSQPAGDLDEWWRRLCASGTGVLYEDACLQVGA